MQKESRNVVCHGSSVQYNVTRCYHLLEAPSDELNIPQPSDLHLPLVSLPHMCCSPQNPAAGRV